MDGLLISLALVFLGAGERINRPQPMQVIPGQRPSRINPWKPKPLGLILDAIGIALFVLGLLALLRYFRMGPFAP
jgi:hypothetical protein